MKKLGLAVLGLCVLGLAIPSAQAKGGKNKSRSVDVFAKYDTNADGRLDDTEKEAMKKALDNDYSLKMYDTNKDGKLSDEEIAVIRPEAKAKKRKNK